MKKTEMAHRGAGIREIPSRRKRGSPKGWIEVELLR